MTVAYVTMGFPLDVETFACTDVRALRALGVEVTVSTLLPAAPHADRMLRHRGLSGLAVDHATVGSWLRGLARAVRHPRLLASAIWLIARYTWRRPVMLGVSLALLPRVFDVGFTLEQRRPDVVHLFWGHYPALVAFLLRRRHTPSVISMFLGAYDLVYRYGPSRVVARRADVVWTHAQENVPVITALGVAPERIAVVHRGVDLEVFTPAPKVSGRVVCAARLCRDKHVDDVIDAFAVLRTERPHASLVILGDGPERAALEQRCHQHGLAAAVRFTGHVPHHEVRDAFAVAECFVLMSREDTERLTNAVKEAMACGCVAIVTRSPGIDELMTDGDTGFVIAPGDVPAAVARLMWASAEPDAAARMGRAAAARIRDRFDVAHAMAAYLHRWQILAAQTRRGRPILNHAMTTQSPSVVP